MVILKANPGILKRGSGIKMWMWLRIDKESYLGFENTVRMRKIVEKVDSCCYGCELFRIAKQSVGEKKDIVRVVLKMIVGQWKEKGKGDLLNPNL